MFIFSLTKPKKASDGGIEDFGQILSKRQTSDGHVACCSMFRSGQTISTARLGTPYTVPAVFVDFQAAPKRNDPGTPKLLLKELLTDGPSMASSWS
jgi:hypothetical protein